VTNDTAGTPSRPIRLRAYRQPDLQAGDYELSACQSLAGPGGEAFKNYEAKIQFRVEGPRFTISEDEVLSVYPPDGSAGDFSKTLPHIVLRHASTPWQRSIGGIADQTETLKCGWLAVVSMDAGDFPTGRLPEPVRGTVADVLPPGISGNLFGPDLGAVRLSEKDLAEPCDWIDVPLEVLTRIAPNRDDLAYLAHVRQRSGADASGGKEGDVAVVMGARFPREPDGNEETEVETLNLLVSLEGHAAWFDPGRGLKPNRVLRLVVLKSWRFRCGGTDPVTSAMRRLSVGFETLAEPEGAPDTPAGKIVSHAASLGFVPLRHSQRNGAERISWYRGPFLPYVLDLPSRFQSRPTADSLLRRETSTGMLDTSYAVAYSLGRLLALNSPAFLSALQSVRRPARSKRRQDRRKSDTTIAAAWQTALKGTRDEDEGPDQSAMRVTSWLQHLLRLEPVPTAYLLPDERILRTDEMRFFYLDPNWIKALLEGACSHGRLTAEDAVDDSMLWTAALHGAISQAGRVDSAAPAASPLIGGFLLRSPLVDFWGGLEVQARRRSGDSFETLSLMRAEKLAPDTMLCLYHGRVDEISIHQPTQTQHFGALPDQEGYCRKVGDQAKPLDLRDGFRLLNCTRIAHRDAVERNEGGADQATLAMLDKVRRHLDRPDAKGGQPIARMISALTKFVKRFGDMGDERANRAKDQLDAAEQLSGHVNAAAFARLMLSRTGLIDITIEGNPRKGALS